MRYLLLIPTGSERACKTMLHAPDVQCSLYFVFASLSLLDLKKEASHNLKIAAVSQQSSTAQAHCFELSMERLFSPFSPPETLRFPGERFQELNLNVSTQELLSAERAFTYAELYAMTGNGDKVAWLTPHTAVARGGKRVVGYWGYFGKYRFHLVLTVKI
jgi:hypothetical protein